jgi:hypothetical protein
MPISEEHVCQCVHCQGSGEHPDKKVHKQINLLASRLDEQQRRWFVAVEANRHGYAGIGFRTRDIEHSHVNLGDGCAGRAALEDRTVACPDPIKQDLGTFSLSFVQSEAER